MGTETISVALYPGRGNGQLYLVWMVTQDVLGTTMCPMVARARAVRGQEWAFVWGLVPLGGSRLLPAPAHPWESL